MQPAGIGIGWFWILGLLLLALLGLFLLWRGLRPRRSGTTPYCRKCGYNLTGTDRDADEARCPECGTDVTSRDAVVFGERRVRWRRVVAGVICMLLGIAPLTIIVVGELKQVDWYSYKPTMWVLRDFERGSAAIAQRAIKELQRRLTADQLSASQLDRLTDVCLTEHGRPSWRKGISDWALELLDERYRAGELTEQQLEQFFTQMYRVELQVRSEALLGEPTAYRVAFELRTPRRIGSEVEICAMLLDGQRMAGGSSWSSSHGGRVETGAIGGDVTVAEAGQHTLTASVRAESYVDREPGSGTPDHAFEIPLEQTFDAVAESSEATEVVRSLQFDDVVAGNVQISELTITADTADPASGERKIHGRISYGRDRPIGLAFSVLAELDGRWILLDDFTMAPEGASDGLVRSFDGDWPKAVNPEAIDILLRSNPDVQRKAIDVYPIWGGSIRFDSVPVRFSEDGSYGWSSSEPFFSGRLWEPNSAVDTPDQP